MVGALGALEAGHGRGQRSELDVTLIAGGDRGDLCELFGGGDD